MEQLGHWRSFNTRLFIKYIQIVYKIYVSNIINIHVYTIFTYLYRGLLIIIIYIFTQNTEKWSSFTILQKYYAILQILAAARLAGVKHLGVHPEQREVGSLAV